MKKLLSKSVQKDESGTTVVEFGIIAIPMCVMMLGTLDIGHTYYVNAILTGELNELARSSSLEGSSVTAQQNVIDARVKKAIQVIAPNSTVTTTRRYYKTFSKAAAAEAEEWTDTNGDGICNEDEPYVDANVNDVWDSDGGDSGQGGARDVVIIKVEVTYPRMFPVKKLIGMPEDVILISDSILANQPYAAQSDYTTAITRQCTDD